MRFVLGLVFIVVTVCACAQNKVDSLLTIWNNEALTDSIRLDAVHQVAHGVYLFNNADSAIYFAQQHLEFAQRKGLGKEVALAINTQGNAHNIKGEMVDALLKFRRSLAIRIDIDDKRGIAGSYINIGNVYFNQNQSSKAIYYLKKGIAVCDEIDEKLFKANALSTIGSMYLQQEDNERSLQYFEKALAILEEIGHANAAFVQQAIGTIYTKLGDLDKALNCYQECLSITKSANNVFGIASGLSGIGYVHQLQGNLEEALDYYLQSKKLMEELGHNKGMIEVFVGIGSVYIEANKSKQAIDICNKALNYSIETIDRFSEKYACECLYKAHKLNGDGFKALSFHERMKDLDDSLREEETAEKLQQMEFNNKVYADSVATVEKEQAISAAHREEVNRKNKIQNILIGAGLIVLLLAGAIYSRLSYVRKAKGIIEKERDRSEELLLNILPVEVAEELKNTGASEAKHFDEVSILFTDFKSFTQTAEKLTAKELVNEINTCFKAFDHICEKYGIEKIKTIGDSYMAAAGLGRGSQFTEDGSLQTVNREQTTVNLTFAALEMQEFITTRSSQLDTQNKTGFEMRAGIHTGPVVAGIVGVKKFQYDIWGDTVNTASRMESHGEVGKVNISQATYEILKEEDESFQFEAREMVNVKGKGDLAMFFVKLNEGPDDQTKV